MYLIKIDSLAKKSRKKDAMFLCQHYILKVPRVRKNLATQGWELEGLSAVVELDANLGVLDLPKGGWLYHGSLSKVHVHDFFSHRKEPHGIHNVVRRRRN
jgi:hypothetical protein